MSRENFLIKEVDALKSWGKFCTVGPQGDFMLWHGFRHAIEYASSETIESLQRQLAEANRKLEVVREVITRISIWDALDIPDSDGAFWKRELNKSLLEAKP